MEPSDGGLLWTLTPSAAARLFLATTLICTPQTDRTETNVAISRFIKTGNPDGLSHTSGFFSFG